MGKDDRNVTLRRTMQQVKHCVEEALSVVEEGEDPRCSADDLDQAFALIQHIRETYPAIYGPKRAR